MRAAGLTILAGCLTCSTGPTYQSRNVDLSATLGALAPGATSASGSGRVLLREARGNCVNEQGIGFLVLGTGLSGPAVAAHIHEGSPATPGRLLYSLVIQPSQFAPEVITTSGASNVAYEGPFAGPLPFAELFDVLGGGRTYMDVHTSSEGPPELVGQLTILQSADWHSVRCGSD